MREIIGVDEVGRGALAGPIVAAAVRIVRPNFFTYDSVTDSKKLSREKRELLKENIEKACVVLYGIVSHKLIDRLGIQQANVLAIEHAVRGYAGNHEIHSDYVGGFKNYSSLKNIKLHKQGELALPEIAAASIMAKVFRDEIMKKSHFEYPQYGFDKHVGYGTKQHVDAIRKYGAISIHRLSFITRIDY